MIKLRKFEVCIKGENFQLEIDGKVEKKEFYAARFVEAIDSSTAVEMAMDILRADLKDRVQNDPADPPVMTMKSGSAPLALSTGPINPPSAGR